MVINMKLLFWDCGMGCAGDMLSAALLALCPDPAGMLEKLNALGIPGVRYTAENAEKCGIVGTRLRVTCLGDEEGGSAPHAHHGLHLGDIRALIASLAMLAADMKLEDAVSTIADTLPINQDINSAFSTFSIMRIVNNERAEIIQYENPNVILLRAGKNCEIPCNTLRIGDKEILQSEIKLQENDIFFLMSDGVLYASNDGVYNEYWDRDHIISYMAPLP